MNSITKRQTEVFLGECIAQIADSRRKLDSLIDRSDPAPLQLHRLDRELRELMQHLMRALEEVAK
jgi:hypothetical protein